MSKHVTPWLEAYYDGELPGRRARQVETHLEACPECLAELESLSTLSTLLKQVPEPNNLTLPETFAAQVGLCLPRRPEQSGWQKALRTGWQWIPVGLLGTWVFMQTTFIVSGILMWLLQLIPGADHFAGFLLLETREASLWGEITNISGAEWTDFGRFGLDILRDGGPLGWGVTLNLGLTILLGMLYISWLASWWIQKFNEEETSTKINRTTQSLRSQSKSTTNSSEVSDPCSILTGTPP